MTRVVTRRRCLVCQEPIQGLGMGAARLCRSGECRAAYQASLTELRCSDCRKVWPVSAFGRNRYSITGRTHYCRGCTNRRNRACRERQGWSDAGAVAVTRICICGAPVTAPAAAQRYFCGRECKAIAKALIIDALLDAYQQQRRAR